MAISLGQQPFAALFYRRSSAKRVIDEAYVKGVNTIM